MAGYFLKTKAFWLCASVGLVAIAVVGCGGGGGSSSAAERSPVTVQTGPLSKAQFIKKADAVCEKSWKQFKVDYSSYTSKHAREYQAHPQTAIRGLMGEVFVPNYEKRIEEIAALGAPPSDKSELEAFVRSYEDSLQTVRNEPSKATESLDAVFAKPLRAEQRYGLRGCIVGSIF